MFNFFKRFSSPPSLICLRLSATWSSRSFLVFSNQVWKCWKAEIFNCDWGMLLLSHWELTFPAPSQSFLLPQREIARFRAFEINNPSFYWYSAVSRRVRFRDGFVSQKVKVYSRFIHLRCVIMLIEPWHDTNAYTVYVWQGDLQHARMLFACTQAASQLIIHEGQTTLSVYDGYFIISSNNTQNPFFLYIYLSVFVLLSHVHFMSLHLQTTYSQIYMKINFITTASRSVSWCTHGNKH